MPHKTKIVIPGNHDIGLDVKQYEELWKKRHKDRKEDPVENRKIFTNATMLYDEAIVLDCGIKIYGSPYSLEFFGWSFALKNEQASKECYSKIPEDTDILMTHGPPYGILDTNMRGEHCGDIILLQEI